MSSFVKNALRSKIQKKEAGVGPYFKNKKVCATPLSVNAMISMGLRSTKEAFLLHTQQPQVQIPAPPRFFSLQISLWTVLRSNPSMAKQWISQMQLVVTSKAKYYKKYLMVENDLLLLCSDFWSGIRRFEVGWGRPDHRKHLYQLQEGHSSVNKSSGRSNRSRSLHHPALYWSCEFYQCFLHGRNHLEVPNVEFDFDVCVKMSETKPTKLG